MMMPAIAAHSPPTIRPPMTIRNAIGVPVTKSRAPTPRNSLMRMMKIEQP